MFVPRDSNDCSSETHLTGRQKEILELLSFGYTNADISRLLSISPNTVKAHVATVYKTLDVGNRTEAVHRYRSIFGWREGRPDGRESAILVAPFRTKKKRQAKMAESLSDLVSTHLARWGRFPVLVAKKSGAAAPPEGSAKAVHRIEADLVESGPGSILSLRLVSTENDQIRFAQDFDLPGQLGPKDLKDAGTHLVAVLMVELLKVEHLRADRDDSAGTPPVRCMVFQGLHLIELWTHANCRRAQELFSRAVQLAPNDALAHFGLAKTHYLFLIEQWSDDSARTIEALHEHAEQAFILEPDHPDVLQGLALSCLVKGMFEKAIRLIEESVRINPCSISGFNLLGQIHALRGRAREGLAYMEESARLSVHTAAYTRNQGALALVRFVQGDYAECADACNDGLMFERNTFLLALLASASALEGNAAQAKNAHDRLILEGFELGAIMSLLGGISQEPLDRFLHGFGMAGSHEPPSPSV